jgi:RNA polymerase sigma-70 factor, ECF subfamily
MVSREVIAACRRGDPAAFEEVVRATYRQVYTQAFRLVGDPKEAEDVSQEAYLRVFRAVSGFREESKFETWLYRIVANAAMNHLSKRSRFGDVLAEPEDDRLDPVAPHRPAEEVTDRAALAEALGSLSDSARTVVVLKDVYGLSCREIGEMVGASEGAVKVRLHRARRRLKDLLATADVEGGHEM